MINVGYFLSRDVMIDTKSEGCKSVYFNWQQWHLNVNYSSSI